MGEEYQKLQVSSVKDAFLAEMLRRILSGELKPGERLPNERELAARMGISRTSVNHGILELESMGFVEIQPRQGTVVTDYRKYQTPQTLAALMNYGSIELDHPLFRDLMDTRRLLEKECARLACTQAYPATLDKMQCQVGRMLAGPEFAADAQYLFHYELMKASGNSVYSMIFRGFEPLLRALIAQHYAVVPEDWRAAAEQHGQLLAALRAHDEAQAVLLVGRILDHGIGVLEKSYPPEPALP